MCDFSHDSCNWTASVGRMRWIQAQDIHDNMFFMRLDMSQYFSNDLVTIGQLRYYMFKCPIQVEIIFLKVPRNASTSIL